MSIGKNIKKFRMKKNISQQSLANLIKKSKSSIEKYESGKTNIPIDVLGEIAKVLDVPLVALMDNLDLNLYHNLVKEIGYRDYEDLNRASEIVFELMTDRELAMNLAYADLVTFSDARNSIINFLIKESKDESLMKEVFDESEMIEIFSFIELSTHVKIKEILNKRKLRNKISRHDINESKV